MPAAHAEHDPPGYALIVGATGDIGSAIAVQLAGSGRELVLLGRDAGRLDAVATAARAAGASSVARFRVDLLDEQHVQRTIDAITGEIGVGAVTTLVYAAGDSVRGDVLSVSAQDWQRAFGVKLFAAWQFMRSTALLREGSSITVITGETGALPSADFVLGCVNSATAGLVKSAALSLSSRGIRVNAVSPGPVRGRRFESRLGREDVVDDSDRAAAREKVLDGVLIERPIEPVEIAEAVEFLIRSSAITGEIISVSGGKSAARL